MFIKCCHYSICTVRIWNHPTVQDQMLSVVETYRWNSESPCQITISVWNVNGKGLSICFHCVTVYVASFGFFLFRTCFDFEIPLGAFSGWGDSLIRLERPCVNSLRPDGALVRESMWSSLVQVMACRRPDVKQLPGTMLTYCQLNH